MSEFIPSGGMSPPQPDVSEKHYSAGPSDGGVAMLGWDSVYLPTFAGVVRWDISGAEPVPDPSLDPNDPSFQPAQDGADIYITEHLEIENLGSPGSDDWRLLAATAEGNFFAWGIRTGSHDPLPGHIFEPTVSDYWGPSMEWDHTINAIYGNDISTWTDTATGDRVVLIDYAKLGQPKLRIGRYDWSDPTAGAVQDGWLPAIVCDDPAPPPGLDIKGFVRDLSASGDWALVAGNGGFVVVDLVSAQPTDWVYTNDVGGLSYAHVMGIERYGDRIFASLGDNANHFAFAMYGFDPGSGRVVQSDGVTPTDAPIAVLFDEAPGKPDAFPDLYLNEGERMSLIELEPSPAKIRLYSGTGNGHVVEIEWDEQTDTMTPKSYWHNEGYFGHIGDCNVYKDYNAIPTGFGPMGPPTAYTLKVLVVKSQETFEIVSPPDFQ